MRGHVVNHKLTYGPVTVLLAAMAVVKALAIQIDISLGEFFCHVSFPLQSVLFVIFNETFGCPTPKDSPHWCLCFLSARWNRQDHSLNSA